MPEYPVKSAERVLRVLELFQTCQTALTLHEVASALTLPRPSTLALLKTLVGMDYLIFEPKHKTYFPSLRLVSLGNWVANSLFKDSPVREIARQLQIETTEHVVVSVQNDTHVHYLQVLHGAETKRYGARVGGSQILTNSSAGLSLLSAMSDDAIDRMCRRINIVAKKQGLSVQPEAVLAKTRTINRQGYAVTVGKPHPEGMNLVHVAASDVFRPAICHLAGRPSNAHSRQGRLAA